MNKLFSSHRIISLFLLLQQRMSFSKYNVNCLGDNPMYTSLPSPNALRRTRQNSVFVGSSTMAVMNPPRRVKSAMDIQHMVLSDYSPISLSGCSSLLPIVGAKRPSITIELANQARHRASIVDQPFMSSSHHHHPSKSYHRRPSCLGDRPPIGRHRHFISFDQPTTSWDRRTSITIERPANRRHNTLSFDYPGTSTDQPSLIIEPPSRNREQPLSTINRRNLRSPTGRSCPESMVSLHQPSNSYLRRPSFHLDMPSTSAGKQHRLSVSLDNASVRMERRSSSTTDSRSLRSPNSCSFDETQIKLSNLEHSKVSDV